jgi:hypothetical protein
MSLVNHPTGSATLNAALQFARDAGAILIAAAGNFGIGAADLSGPGASPLTISVGATDHNDARASFSSTGKALDVVAPGLGVGTVFPDSSQDTSITFNGTSAATPIVSGITTLLLSLNPSLTHDEVLDILARSAEDLVGPPSEDTPGRDDFFGHGRVSLHKALTLVPLPPGRHFLEVIRGSGDGIYPMGTMVTVSADPPPPGQQFTGWSGDIAILSNPFLPTTTAPIPGMNVSITATFGSPSSNDKIRYYPRSGNTERIVGGVFEGTNADPVNGPYETVTPSRTIPRWPGAKSTWTSRTTGIYAIVGRTIPMAMSPRSSFTATG